MKGRGKREIPEKIRRPAASYGMIPTCENLGETPPGSPRWEASSLTTTPPRPRVFQEYRAAVVWWLDYSPWREVSAVFTTPPPVDEGEGGGTMRPMLEAQDVANM
ncbi:hypothetical protein PR048_000016 [Dryococelus australis]|uniref:Uncharacterized protein n=1 Tax=Dryococelus australis TaxID=614101 RepID=A0ABQ9IDF7_9NEOP|nr:hypothetical protein PR048_000016 [Dryococelus australis]